MCKKRIIGFCIVMLTLIVAIGSVSFSFNVSEVSGSFVSKASTPDQGRDGVDAITVKADIAVAAISSSMAAGIEDNLSGATKDIYDINMAKIAEAQAKAKAEAIKAAKAKSSEIAPAQVQPAGANLSSMEAEIVKLINKVRADHGLSQLAIDQSLTNVARARTNDMLSQNYFSHYAPNGSTFFNLLRNSGIGYSNAGENLGNATPANYGSPGAFINAWLNSPSHRDNMLRSSYRLVGIGISDSGGRRVVTTIFVN